MARAKHEDYANGKHDEDNRKHLLELLLYASHDSSHFTLHTSHFILMCPTSKRPQIPSILECMYAPLQCTFLLPVKESLSPLLNS